MPAVSHLFLAADLVERNTITTLWSQAVETAAQNITSSTPLQVICSFQISGQYGPGSRILYYVLVAACVLARKIEWLRNACLAAALIFPAVAAIHGIALAAIHVQGAIDMDIYGAFQFCSIGILTAPATVRLSATYFHNPGRNTIFVWATLLLMGLLALTVEFYRSDSVDCKDDISEFHYGNTTCGLICSIGQGPHSPMRKGSADEIYVVPAPRVLTFGTATLLSAACCIPAVLSMASMWDKILKLNWSRAVGEQEDNEEIEGTNGATHKGMNRVNEIIRGFLSVIEIPIYAAAVIAILVIGEMNFWSKQVKWQTEPMENVGQWAPIVASGMAAFGSLYMVIAEVPTETVGVPYVGSHCTCSHHHHSLDDGRGGLNIIPLGNLAGNRDSQETYQQQQQQKNPADAGKRIKIARLLGTISRSFGTAAADLYDDWEFQHSAANNFPRTPGEEFRSDALRRIESVYNDPSRLREDDARSRRSRANSLSAASVRGNSPSGVRPGRPPTPTMSSPRSGLLQPPSPRTPQQQPGSGELTVDHPRHSSDSEPQRGGNDIESPSPSALPGTTLTLHSTHSPHHPAITVSSEADSPVSGRPAFPAAAHTAP